MMENGKLKAFDVMVIMHPTEEDAKGGETSRIIVRPTTIMANDVEHAKLVASREIGNQHAELLDRCEVLVRPFV